MCSISIFHSKEYSTGKYLYDDNAIGLRSDIEENAKFNL